jgi:hypothetical protein
MHGYETWSLTLREEHRQRIPENRVLRRIFGLKRYEILGDWRGLLNEELHDMYPLPDIIRMIKLWMMSWAWHVERMRKCMHTTLWESQKERDH